MIIISRRLGWLVPIVGILATVFAMMLLRDVPESWFSEDEHTRFVFDGSFAFGCLCIYFLGKKLNNPVNLKISESESDVNEQQTFRHKIDDMIEKKPTHTFFFIKFEYWGIIFGVIYFTLSLLLWNL